MNYEKIKGLYENMPKKMKYFLSPFFRCVITCNPIYKSTYKELDAFENMTESEKKSKQFELLKETLVYADKYVPYYQKLFKEANFKPEEMSDFNDIKKIPLLTKDMAIEAGTDIYSEEKINYYESCTGGSSGRALKVLLDKDSIYKERAFTIHFLSKYGYNQKKTRTLAFWGHNKDADYYYSPMKNEIVISPFKLFDEKCFDDIWDTIDSFKPDFVAGYPSAIYLFAQLMEKHNKSRNFKLVDFYAENHTQEMKNYIEKIMKCKAVSNYGHTERAVFAEEYEKGYKFNDLYGYTEFVPTDNEGEYQIVCTGFTSRKMPLIRYKTDDVVRFNRDGYAEILGHKFSEVYLISKTGTKIFKGALTMHIDVLKKVKQYQYVQFEPGKVFLDLVLLEPLTDEDKNKIIEYLNCRCEGLLDIQLRIVEKIELTRRGKYNWAVNKIGSECEEKK